MKEQIRIGILGYGNLGKGVECAVKQNEDMKLTAVFTRRAPESLKILTEGVPVYPATEAAKHADEVDVLILCGVSATDLDKEATVSRMQTLLLNKKSEYYSELLEGWKEEYPLTVDDSVWDKVIFNRSYALKSEE